MTTTVCPDCGKPMVVCRRYRLEPLAQFMRMTMSATCIEVRISGKSQQHALCHGITRRIVDRIAQQLKEHPSTIWPEVVDHDIEDTFRVCAAEDCSERFTGHPNQRYCCSSCKRRIQARRHRGRHPEKYAARMRAWRAANAEEYREYNRRYQRRWMRLYRERKRAERAA